VLLKRVEDATGADREIDAAMWLLAFEPACPSFDVRFHEEWYSEYLSRTAIECALGMMWVDQMDPPLDFFSANIEDARKLLRRGSRLRHRVRVSVDPYGKGIAFVYDDQDRDVLTAHAPTPALAVCAALLRAEITTLTGASP
jgi:hypothetical protein